MPCFADIIKWRPAAYEILNRIPASFLNFSCARVYKNLICMFDFTQASHSSIQNTERDTPGQTEIQPF
jgi:hypothetical protein